MEWLHEHACVAAVLDPQTCANVAKLTGSVDMAKFTEATFVFCLGDMAAETIDCGVYKPATVGGVHGADEQAGDAVGGARLEERQR